MNGLLYLGDFMNILKLSSKQLALLLFRLAVGVNFLMHGAVRVFGDYAGFASGMTADFSETFLHPLSVTALAYVIPIVELIVGIILISGYKLRYGLILGFLLMTVLIFGMSLLQNWGVVGTQMIYVICLFLLLYFEEDKS